MDKKILYLSFFTPEYKNISEKYIKKSLDIFNLPYKIYEIPSKGNWLRNGLEKYAIIYKELLVNDYIVYLDADAEIIKYPSLFYDIPNEYDIGICYLDWKTFWGSEREKPEVLGGTIYLKKSNKTLKLIEKIYLLSNLNNKWGQMVLEDLLDSGEYNIYKLPLSYCQIIKQDGVIPQDAVILQWQMSRIMKNVI